MPLSELRKEVKPENVIIVEKTVYRDVVKEHHVFHHAPPQEPTSIFTEGKWHPIMLVPLIAAIVLIAMVVAAFIQAGRP